MKQTTKWFAFFLIGAVALSSCKKDKDAEPDFAAQVQGNYTLVSGSVNGITIPLELLGISATVGLTRVDRETVNGTLTFSGFGETETDNLQGIKLTDAGGGMFNLVYEGDNLGKVGNNTIEVVVEDEDGDLVTYVGTKI